MRTPYIMILMMSTAILGTGIFPMRYDTSMVDAPRCVNPDCQKPLPLDKRRGKSYKHKRGWCDCCYSKWWRNGKPEGVWPHVPLSVPAQYRGWPKEARQASAQMLAALAQERRETVFELLEMGVSIEEAAQRVGVTKRTAERYLAGQ